MALRLLSLSLAAAAITFALFWVMQALISTGAELLEGKPSPVVDFVRLKRDSQPETKKREVPDRKPPDQPPPPPQLDFSQNLAPGEAIGEMIPEISAKLDLSGGGLGSGGSDRDVVPLVRVEPQYPIRAKQRGIEGWAEVRFTITKAGTVKDAVITASDPGTVFDKSTLRAVSKWKYNPKVENGMPVERPGVRIRLTYRVPQ